MFRKATKAAIQDVYSKHKAELDKVLTPDKLQRLYELAIVQMNKLYVLQCMSCIGDGGAPIIAIIGYKHMRDFLKQIRGRDHIAIMPDGMNIQSMPDDYMELFRREYMLPSPDQINVKINR